MCLDLVLERCQSFLFQFRCSSCQLFFQHELKKITIFFVVTETTVSLMLCILSLNITPPPPPQKKKKKRKKKSKTTTTNKKQQKKQTTTTKNNNKTGQPEQQQRKVRATPAKSVRLPNTISTFCDCDKRQGTRTRAEECL